MKTQIKLPKTEFSVRMIPFNEGDEGMYMGGEVKIKSIYETKVVLNKIEDEKITTDVIVAERKDFTRAFAKFPITASESHWKNMPIAAAETQAKYWGMRKYSWHRGELKMSRQDLKDLKECQIYINKYFPQFNHYLTKHS